MPHYRVYSVRHDGHYLGPAQVIECATDADAARQASQFVNGCDVELWEGARFILLLPAVLTTSEPAAASNDGLVFPHT